MSDRDQRIYQEAMALWRVLYTDPPPEPGAGVDLLDLITRDLPDAGYDRLVSPHIRPTAVSFPRKA